MPGWLYVALIRRWRTFVYTNFCEILRTTAENSEFPNCQVKSLRVSTSTIIVLFIIPKTLVQDSFIIHGCQWQVFPCEKSKLTPHHLFLFSVERNHFSGRRFLCVFDAERFVIKTKQKLFSSPPPEPQSETKDVQETKGNFPRNGRRRWGRRLKLPQRNLSQTPCQFVSPTECLILLWLRYSVSNNCNLIKL